LPEGAWLLGQDTQSSVAELYTSEPPLQLSGRTKGTLSGPASWLLPGATFSRDMRANTVRTEHFSSIFILKS